MLSSNNVGYVYAAVWNDTTTREFRVVIPNNISHTNNLYKVLYPNNNFGFNKKHFTVSTNMVRMSDTLEGKLCVFSLVII